MKKNIYFFTGPKIGGAELVTRTFYKLIDRKKFDPKFVIIGKLNDIDNCIEPNAIRLNVKKYKYSIFKLYFFIKKHHIDYVFSSIYGISIPLLLVSVVHKKIKIVIRHSFTPDHFKKNSISSYLLTLSYSRAYKIIAQTNEMRLMMIDYYKLDPSKIFVLHNPIDYERIENGIKTTNPFQKFESTKKYVAIGNIRFIKGFDTLIKAFKIVVGKYPNSKLVIIGRVEKNDKYFKTLNELVRILNLQDKVEFTGFISNPYPYIYNADCFVLSSRKEGLPNVLLEASYLKKPIVATKCIPFIERIIMDDINGILVDIDNHVEMGNAMIKALKLNSKCIFNYEPTTASKFNELFQ